MSSLQRKQVFGVLVGQTIYPVEQSPLFRLSSRKRLAQNVLSVDFPFLERLANGRSNYSVFKRVTGGKERRIELPCSNLQKIHLKLFTLLAKLETPDYLHSGVVGRSYVTNAMVHIGNVPLVNLDIKKYYPSVDGARIYRFFAFAMGCSPDVAGLLTRLCTYDNHVPIGSCVSQALAFHATKPLFDELHQLAVEAGVRESYYVDDLTWSGANATPSFLWKAKQIVHRHGFDHHKGRCFAAHQNRLVTGVLLNGLKATILPSKELEMWKALCGLGELYPHERPAALDRLIGWLTAASQIEPRFADRIPKLRQQMRDASTALAA